MFPCGLWLCSMRHRRSTCAAATVAFTFGVAGLACEDWPSPPHRSFFVSAWVPLEVIQFGRVFHQYRFALSRVRSPQGKLIEYVAVVDLKER
jgi:hypothetical protein